MFAMLQGAVLASLLTAPTHYSLVGTWTATDGKGAHATHSTTVYRADHSFKIFVIGYPTRTSGLRASGTYKLDGGLLTRDVKTVHPVGVDAGHRTLAEETLKRQYSRPASPDRIVWRDRNHFALILPGRTTPMVYTRTG